MLTAEKNIIAKLQSLPEFTLTQTVIIPLLESLGYQQVEYYGGESEEGKDIVCWRIDEVEEPELTVAQVKHYKASRRASAQGASSIVNQLINASAKRLPYTDKSLHLPTHVYLISTYEIDTKTLQKRFDTFPTLHEQQLRIIDGPKLASLLLKKTPHIITNLLGPQIAFESVIKPSLNNESLLSAIGFRGFKDLKTIYVDLDFSLGKPTTRLFFNSSFKPVIGSLNISVNDWCILKSIILSISKEFKLDYLEDSIDVIEENYKKILYEHKKWKQKADTVQKRIYEITRQINILNAKYIGEDERLKSQFQILEIKIDALDELGKSSEKMIDSKKLENEIKNLNIKVETIEESLAALREDITRHQSMNENFEQELNVLQKSEPPLTHVLSIDGHKIVEKIVNKRQWIIDKINKFNRRKPGILLKLRIL